MKTITLGSTGITVPQNGFGALPIQRIPKENAVALLRRAYLGGMRYFDTARGYTDSEEKLGAAFGDGWLRREEAICSQPHRATHSAISRCPLATLTTDATLIPMRRHRSVTADAFCLRRGRLHTSRR